MSYEHLRPNDLNLSVPIATAKDKDETSKPTKLISQSATDLAVTQNDSVSPSAQSTGAPSSASRNRSTTLNKLTRYLRSGVGGAAGQDKDQSNQSNQPRQPPPQIFVSTKSLPESLTSTNPSILNCCPNSLTPVSRNTSERNAMSSDNSKTNESITTPTSTPNDSTTNNKTTLSNLRQWKLPKYLRKSEARNNNNGVKCDKDCVMNESSTDGGYQATENDQSHQLLPIIIQKTNTESSLGAIETNANNVTNSDRDANLLDTLSSSPTQRSNLNINNTDIIDVRAYISQSRSSHISQSRSDISTCYPERADSCKFRSPRSACCNDISPMRRPRSKTVALTSQEHLNSRYAHELRVPNALGRKYSQNCHPTTANNLQLPKMGLNQPSISQERLSTGDFTSWVSNISDDPTSGDHSSAIVLQPNDEINLDPIRKQSDLQLVKCVKENAKSHYLVTPPISRLTLFFTSPLMEKEFRAEAHQLNKRRGPLTIAYPIYNTYFDILISVVIFTSVTIGMFLLSAYRQLRETELKGLWYGMLAIFCLIEVFTLVLFTKKIFRKRWQSQNIQLQKHDVEKRAADKPIKSNDLHKTTSNVSPSSSSRSSSSIQSATSYNVNKFFEDKIISAISTWYRWHFSLGFLMSLPAILTLTHFIISTVTNEQSVFGCHYGFLMLVCVVQFCNFTQLNCWMRDVLATCVAIGFIMAISMKHSISPLVGFRSKSVQFSNKSSDASNDRYDSYNGSISSNAGTEPETRAQQLPNCFQIAFDLEIYIDLILILALVFFLNREFEIFYRFSFYSSSIAEKDKIRVQQMKDQADILLHNIIPTHVVDHLKNTAKYSENHHNVAIIFASLINFNELYDESYLGGREYLRVLNELIGDFDELISRPEFLCVEKIKTIGSTFMAASCLDNNLRDDNGNGHINALMEFAWAMQDVVAAFNKNLLEFDLILRVGFNVGSVMAGVIGTTKLHYDIWGDAVNVASRMESTGVAGRIQVGEDCKPFLDDQLYEFESRGKVFVKGKGDMEVYLVKRKETN